MNKAELIEKIAESVDCSKKDAETMLACFLDTVTSTIKKGKDVVLTGFGTFSSKKRKARIGVNPRTGEKIKIAAVTVPKFKAGKKLKDALK